MPHLKVLKVHDNVRDWNSTQGGPMKVYAIDVQDVEGAHRTVEWSRKTTSKPPEVGMEFDADVKKIDFPPGWKLHNVQLAGGKGKGDYYKPRDPRELAVIQRQAEQNRALQFLAMTKTFADLDAFTDGDEGMKLALNLVFRVADAFHKDSERAGDRVTQAAPAGLTEVRKDIERTGISDVPSGAQEAFSHPDPGPESDMPWGGAAA